MVQVSWDTPSRTRLPGALRVFYVLVLVTALVVTPCLNSDATRHVVEGRLSVEELFLVIDNEEVVGVYPEDVFIEYTHTYSYEVNETGEVSFEIVEEKWGWVKPRRGPRQTVYIPELDATLHVEYDVDLSAVTGGSVGGSENTTYTHAGIVVYFNMRLRLGFRDPPETTGSVDIGEYIREYVFGGVSPEVYYRVVANKYVDGRYVGKTRIYNKLALSLDNLVLTLYTISFNIKEIKRTGYAEAGDLDSGVKITPLYDVTVCGNIIGGSRSLQVVVSLDSSEAVLAVDGDGDEECVVLGNVSLTPGEDTPIGLVVKSGVFTLPLNISREVEGVVLSLGEAVGRAIGSGNRWEFYVAVPVYVYGYYASWLSTRIEGEVETPYGVVPCSPLEIASQGGYRLTCNRTLTTSSSLTVADIIDGEYSITVTVTDDLGSVHVFKGTVSMGAVDPSHIPDVAWTIYDVALKIVLSGIVFVIVLMIVSILKESITGTPLLDVIYLRGVLLTLIASIIILFVAIPVAYRVFTEILTSIPLFQRYIEPPASGEPKEVFTHLVGYYERLFEAIERDYQVRFIGNMHSLMASLGMMVGFASVFFAVALALSTIFTPGAGTPFASIGGSILSLVFTFLGLLVMVAPGGAIVLVGVAIGRIIILLTTVIVVAATIIGLFMLCIPVPLSQRLGEDLFGAGILYFMVLPMVGPITYSLYQYVVDAASRVIRGTLNVALGPFQFLIPIGPVAEIMIYFVASGASVLIIIVSLAYVLSRTGVATGIGEALSGLVWRG